MLIDCQTQNTDMSYLKYIYIYAPKSTAESKTRGSFNYTECKFVS